MSGSKKQEALTYAGYRKLRPGHIHLFCVKCKRKMSNTWRGKLDPQNAVLVKTFCDRCGQGGKDPCEWFMDAAGNEIEWMY